MRLGSPWAARGDGRHYTAVGKGRRHHLSRLRDWIGSFLLDTYPQYVHGAPRSMSAFGNLIRSREEAQSSCLDKYCQGVCMISPTWKWIIYPSIELVI